MKQRTVLMFALFTAMLFFFVAAGESPKKSGGPFHLDGDVEWVVTSSPGGGSSIFTQNIVDIIKKYKMLGSYNITINYQTDGGGAIGRRRVSQTNSKGKTLLTFNSGDLLPYVTREKSDLDNVKPLAVMATDTQVFLVAKDSPFSDIQSAINSIKQGKRLIVGGSKGDDETVYRQFKEVFDPKDSIDYIRSNSTGEALTQILGGHIGIVIAKPAASYDYVVNGDLVPLVSLGEERLAPPFDTPTFASFGYPQIQFEIFRGIVGPKNMTPQQIAFWNNIFRQVAESTEWRDNYIKKFFLNPAYKSAEESIGYMQSFEDKFLKGSN